MGTTDKALEQMRAQVAGGKIPYAFHRDSGFYVITLRDDHQAIENARCNPGTLKVVNMLTEKTVWSEKS